MPKPKNKNGQQGGNRNTDPDDDDDDDTGQGGDDGFSESQVSRITDIVNAAVSGQLSRKLPRVVSDALDAGLKPLREQLEKRGNVGNDGDDDDDDQQQQQRGNKGDKNRSARKDPELESMRKRMAQIEEERKQERETARNRERDTMLREQLEAAGVDKNRVRGAVAVLRESMKYDEKAGEWTFNAKRDGFDEPVDVSAGVSEWAGTDEGKSYLAPPQGQQQQQQRGGSGVRPSGAGGAARLQNGGRPAADPKAAKVQAKQDAVQNLSKAIDSLGGGVIPLG